MYNFIRITFFSFTIWMLTALINGLLYALVFGLGGLVYGQFWGSFLLATFFSLLFSLPAIFCLWLAFLNYYEEDDLSGRLLKATFIFSLLSCLIIPVLPHKVLNGHWLLLSIIIVVSSLLAVMAHHSILKSFYKYHQTQSDV